MTLRYFTSHLLKGRIPICECSLGAKKSWFLKIIQEFSREFTRIPGQKFMLEKLGPRLKQPSNEKSLHTTSTVQKAPSASEEQDALQKLKKELRDVKKLEFRDDWKDRFVPPYIKNARYKDLLYGDIPPELNKKVALRAVFCRHRNLVQNFLNEEPGVKSFYQGQLIRQAADNNCAMLIVVDDFTPEIFNNPLSSLAGLLEVHKPRKIRLFSKYKSYNAKNAGGNAFFRAIINAGIPATLTSPNEEYMDQRQFDLEKEKLTDDGLPHRSFTVVENLGVRWASEMGQGACEAEINFNHKYFAERIVDNYDVHAKKWESAGKVEVVQLDKGCFIQT